MKQNTFSVRFLMRTERADKDGYAPISALVTINGLQLNFSINRKGQVKDWLKDKGLLKACKPENKEINNDIDSFKSRIYNARAKILSANDILTPVTLKSEMFGDKELSKIPTLLETATQHNENFQKMIGIKYSQGSYKNYKTTLKYLIEFVPTYHNKKDIALKEVNYQFCEAYFTFLTTKKDCKQNGANKQIQRLKKMINYAIKQGYIQTNPMASFSLEFTPVNKVALTMQELERLDKLELQRPVLIKVKDIFIFQCYTGLSYGDTQRLNSSNIEQKGKNEYWLKMTREKTKVAFTVPLLPKALLIIEKYSSAEDKKGGLLPTISNQKMNENLKLIQELAKIEKNLTSHLARHTFATTITLGHGVPIETVSKMLGHTKLATTQMYAKVLDNKIRQDMAKLEEIFKNHGGETK
jgi:site-specific recombinase XerD